MTERVKGIVIKETPANESDKHITLLTEKEGKMRLFAKGARNPKGKLMPATELFSYGEFIYYQGNGFKSITQIELIENFYPLREDISKMAYGMYFLDVIDKTVFEGMESEEVLKLLLYALLSATKSLVDIRLTARVFELKYLQICGFLSEEGLLDSPERFLKGTDRAIKHVFSSDIKNSFAFNASKEVINELSYITKEEMLKSTDMDFETLRFAEGMENRPLN